MSWCAREVSLKCCVSLVDKVVMINDWLNQGLPVAVTGALIVSLWIAGIWTLVKDERGPAVLFTRLLIVGFVLFLAWRFAIPLLV